MTCYILGQIEVTDTDLWAEYLVAGAATLHEYGVESVFASDHPELLEGDWVGPRTVLLKFADRAAAMRWYESPEFAEASKIRNRAAKCNVVLVESEQS